MQNLSELARRLIAAQVEFVLVGGFAAVAHGVEVELTFGRCRIIGIDALIRAKEAMNRDHDRITAKHLKVIIKQQR